MLFMKSQSHKWHFFRSHYLIKKTISLKRKKKSWYIAMYLEWWVHWCHTPNPILGFVTMTSMLISSLNLILTRTNLTFSKTFTKAFLFLFILVSLLKWYNFPLDFQSIYIVPQRITQSTDYSNSKFYIIHLLIL